MDGLKITYRGRSVPLKYVDWNGDGFKNWRAGVDAGLDEVPESTSDGKRYVDAAGPEPEEDVEVLFDFEEGATALRYLHRVANGWMWEESSGSLNYGIGDSWYAAAGFAAGKRLEVIR